ncbi:MAG: peptidoglycan-binding protein [Anaerolineae bacterium]|nr:peptidoglycan-binding protein [Anaerolineae bacterium]
MNKRPKTSTDSERQTPTNRKPEPTAHSTPQPQATLPLPGQASPATILHMQRTMGNKVVQRYLDARETTHTPIQRLIPLQDPDDFLCNDPDMTPPAATVGVPTVGNAGGLDSEHGQQSDMESVPTIGEAYGNNSEHGQHTGNTAVLPETTITGTTGRPTLYQGSTGPYVELLQNKLRGTGENIQVDGIFGSDTKAKVQNFQEAMKLDVDGVVGRRTWEALDAVSRGEAVSDAEMAKLGVQLDLARAYYSAEQYQAALDAYLSLYAEPKLDSKPLFLAGVIFSIGSCHHQLAFAADATPEQKQQRLDQAISWYQEATMREGVESDMIADAATRIRECRLGQPPTSRAELEMQKLDM